MVSLPICSISLEIKLGDFLLLGFLKVRLRIFALEDDGQFSDGFLLSLGPQVRMDLMVGGDLGDSLGFFQGFQDDLGLESSRILFSHGRWCPPYFSPFYRPNL